MFFWKYEMRSAKPSNWTWATELSPGGSKTTDEHDLMSERFRAHPWDIPETSWNACNIWWRNSWNHTKNVKELMELGFSQLLLKSYGIDPLTFESCPINPLFPKTSFQQNKSIERFESGPLEVWRIFIIVRKGSAKWCECSQLPMEAVGAAWTCLNRSFIMFLSSMSLQVALGKVQVWKPVQSLKCLKSLPELCRPHTDGRFTVLRAMELKMRTKFSQDLCISFHESCSGAEMMSPSFRYWISVVISKHVATVHLCNGWTLQHQVLWSVEGQAAMLLEAFHVSHSWPKLASDGK